MQKQKFDSDWRFHLGDPKDGLWREPDDSDWRVVNLPHDWSVELDRTPDAPSAAFGGFFQMGRGWYRKTFTIPETWQGKKVVIEFEGVYMNAEVRLNRNILGRHPYGYTSFHYDLTPYLKPGEENVLTVVVYNDCQINSRWYSGSGIYRHVWLHVAEPVHIEPWGIYVTTPEVSAEKATVVVETAITNELESSGHPTRDCLLRSHIVTAEGAIVASTQTALSLADGASKTVRQKLTVTDPILWSLDTPHLYRLESELRVTAPASEAAASETDLAATPFGIRTLSFDAQQGFRLNGEPLLLKGGCVHHDNGVLGAASYDRSEARKIELLQASGFNAVRCAHNPPSPAFLDACDRLGMLVMDEAFDCWRMGKTPHDYHVAFADWWQRDLDSMVLRDRNHPSIIMWSIGNEVGERDGTSDGARWADILASRVRELDPTRPVTAAINGVANWQGLDDAWPTTDGVFAALDVGGYNYREVHYLSDHARYPDRIMVGTESTAGEALQHWNSVVALPYVIGDFVWTSLDYLGEAGIGRVHFEPDTKAFLGAYPWHQANCGDLDLCGFKRPQSYYRDMFWNVGEPLYIAVHHPTPADPVVSYWGWPLVGPDWTWPGQEGQTFTVDVYARCERVELFLNDTSVGVQPAGPGADYMASFEIPYEPGTLKAVGYTNGEEPVELEIRTAAAPSALRLSADRDVLLAQPGDLSFITVEVLDAAGRRHPKADHAISFAVDGPGAIAAVGNGNPVSEETYTDTHRRAFEGRCLLVVKTSGESGDIHVQASAQGLAPAHLTLTVGS